MTGKTFANEITYIRIEAEIDSNGTWRDYQKHVKFSL